MIANYYNAYLEHRRDRPARAWRRPRPTSTRSTRIADKHAAQRRDRRHAPRRHRPAQRDQFPDREPVRHLRHAGPGNARRAAALPDAGRHRPARARILSRRPTPRWRTSRNKYTAYVQTILQAAGYPDPQARRRRIMDLETKIAKAHEPREQSEDCAKGAQVWTRAAARARRRRASTGQRCSTPRSSAARRSSMPIISQRSRSWPRWSARSRSRTGRTGSPSTR